MFFIYEFFSTFKDGSFIIEKYSKFFNGTSFSVPKISSCCSFQQRQARIIGGKTFTFLLAAFSINMF